MLNEPKPAEAVPAPDATPRLRVVNDRGEVIGYVELPKAQIAVSREELDRVKHELVQLRNQVLRNQALMKLLETRVGRHHET